MSFKLNFQILRSGLIIDKYNYYLVTLKDFIFLETDYNIIHQ